MKKREVYDEKKVRYEERDMRYYMLLAASYIDVVDFADLLLSVSSRGPR